MLMAYFDHPNGWLRDNAQKEIVVRGDKSVIPALRKMVTEKDDFLSKGPGYLARIHALWTLEGLEAIDKEVLLTALQDEHPQVRRTAVWISEPYLKADDGIMIEKVGNLKDDEDYDVRVQLLLSLYNSKSNKAKEIIKEIIDKSSNNEMLTATKTALDKNEDVRTFGKRLGGLDEADRRLIIKGSAIF